jgi:iron complex outermembrane recepter protein
LTRFVSEYARHRAAGTFSLERSIERAGVKRHVCIVESMMPHQLFARERAGLVTLTVICALSVLNADAQEAQRQDTTPPPGAGSRSENPAAGTRLHDIVVTAPPPRRAAPRHQATRPANQTTPPATPQAPPGNAEPATGPVPPGRAAPDLANNPSGETATTVDRSQFKDRSVFSISDILQDSPGVAEKLGNGPRDIGISIRGSNANNSFGIRNIQVLEDGFPVTQPDGLSRTDLTDPHAYQSIDVFRGPNSVMFGNFATGGAIDFHTRSGSDIRGFEIGSDVGGYGYLNNYFAIGNATKEADVSVFASDVRGNGYIANSAFNTKTVNSLAKFAVTPDDTVTLKIINNEVATSLPLRLSLNQFQQNPFQKGCTSAVGAAPGCATVALSAFGISSDSVPQSASEADLGRHDTRTVIGGRWEHNFDNDTTWRTQLVFDNKNIDQPTGATSAIGDTPAVNLLTDVTRRSQLFGLDAAYSVGAFYNYEVLNNDTYNIAPGGSLGALQSFYNGQHSNVGGRTREEIALGPNWTAVVGAGIEDTELQALNTAYQYTTAGQTTATTQTAADREFLNNAEEAALLYRPDTAWQFRGRVATGYGTPQASNLFVNAQGVAGNNTQLQSQTNLGYDIGADWRPTSAVKLSVTGFYEFFHNELVTQSPGAGLQSYTFNAPASEHRGVEVAADWRPAPGWRYTLAYSYDNQIFTDYVEQLSASTFTSSFNRAGNKIPGVAPNELTTRLAYDQPDGPWRGLGGFVEVQAVDAFFIDNANLVKTPGYATVNLNMHYSVDIQDPYLKNVLLFAEVRNVLNQTYVASANNVSDSISNVTGAQNSAATVAAATGSIYAGAPRTFLAGIRLKFQ